MTQQGKTKTSNNHPIIVFIILLAVFLIPWGVARFMFYHHDTISEARVNNGHLLTPPLSITQLPLKNSQGQLLDNVISNTKNKPAANLTTNGKWLLMLLDNDECSKNCQHAIYNLRQIQIATGKNRNRVERAVLTLETPSDQIRQILQQPNYRNTRLISVDTTDFMRIMSVKVDAPYATQPGTLYLADPLGNIILSYPPKTPAMAVFKDLKRLLKVSQIG